MKNSILGKARWLREVALATSKNNGARVAREWLKYAAMFVMLFTIGSGNVWGADVKFTFSSYGWSNGTAHPSVTSSPITITANGGGNNGKYYTSDKSWRMYSGGSLTITAETGYQVTAVSSSPTQTFTVSNGSASISFSGTVKFTSITVTYEPVCSGTQLETPVVTATPSDGQVILTWPNVANASGYQLKWNGGDWVAATSPVTKTGLTNGTSYTYQVKAIGNGSTYCDGDASEEASATPNVYYTVTWKNNGSEYTTKSVASGQKPTFPSNPSSCDGTSTTFVGWTATPWSGKLDDVSDKTIYTSGSAMPNVSGPVTYHAVFAKETSTLTPVPDTWTRITSTSQLTDGATVMLVHYSKYAINNTLGATSCTANAEITNSNAALRWIAVKSGSKWKFKTSAGKYLSTSATADNTTLSLNQTYDEWTISADAGGYSNCFNLNNGNELEYFNSTFKLYTWSSKYKSAYPFYIYIQKTTGSTTYSQYLTTCQACVEPTNPTNTSITAYGATIGWTGGGTGTLDRYEYAVWMDGDDEPTSGFTSNGTNTSNALTGLLSNTTYRWKVRKVCTGGDGESMWLKSSFTTSNVALTFSVPTGASAVLGQNSDVALPSAEVPTNCGDCWAFVGWTTAEHAESSSAPAKLFASDAIVHLAQADGSTLYAVYKKDEFKLIKATSQMENNGYYVLTSLHESHEYAMTNVLNGKYATSTDVTSLISEPEVDNYLLKNPSESTIWKFTGTASSGRFYNESSGLYLDLTEKEGAILKSSTTDNLVITIPNVKELAFDIASVAESSHYLYMWTSHQWSVDNAHRIGTDNSAYLYKRISLVYATTPSCPIYTVTWDVNGASTSTTEVTKCEGYLSALPGAPADNTLSGCQTNGKFMGWSASKVMPAQDIAPADIFSEVEDAPEITEDVTFYAVFANGVAGAATPVNTTYTFNSKLWGDATNSWSSNTAGSELTSERGIQILGNTSAEGITKNNYTDVTKVVVTYCTNASSGAGSVTVTVGDTEFGTNSISKPSSGGATLKTFTYTHAAATGKVKISASASSSSIYIYSVQIYYTGAGTVYEQYRTACCNDPGFSFTGENDAPVTEYVIVRENMASASDAVEIDCNYTSSNTTGAITWYSTRRAAKTFPSTGAYTWTTPTEQPTNLNIDLANKKIAAKETGVWTITISQADGGTTYCPVDAVVTVRVKTVDKFIDNVNGNFSGEAQRLEDVGNGITLPTETTFTINGGCSDGVTRRLVGWIKASDLATYASGGRVNKIDDWKTADPATNKVIAPGTKVQATGVTWYAVWGVEK